MRITKPWGSSPVLLSLLLAGCGELIVSGPASDRNLADFEAAWTWVDSVYPALDLKGIDWNGVYADYRPRADAAQGDEIYQVLHDMLSELADAHLYYKSNGGARFFPYMSPRLLAGRSAFSAQVVRSYFEDELHIAGKDGVEYGVLEGAIGYVRITHFNEDGMMDDFPTVMDFVGQTEGLIIDVRNNTGGDHDKVEAVVGWFIETEMAWPPASGADGVLEEPWPAMRPGSAAHRYPNPVVVLINGASLSAGELFPEVMKQLPDVTVVGDTTAGAGCNDRAGFRGDRYLPSGKMIHVPTWCIRRYDGVPWEWVGIGPDVRVAQSPEDVARGVDRQLEQAIAILR